MKKPIFMLLFCLMFVLVGCIEAETVNVEVVDGYELEAVKGNDTVLEFYVIVKLENSKDDNLFKVNVPVRNSSYGVNDSANYPKGILLNVKENTLIPYKTVNVEVVGGYSVKGDNSVLEFYVIVKIKNSKDGNLFKVNVPVKSRYYDVNHSTNYPKGTLLKVEENALIPFEKEVVVEVVDGYELVVVKGDNAVLEFYVIVKLENSKDDNLFKVNVPVKNSFYRINHSTNYPKGTLLIVKENALIPYEKAE